MGLAFTNVVIDAILVVQAKRDLENGSQDLMSLSWISNGIGGVTGCIVGGLMTQYSHPKYSFLIVSIMGLVVGLNSLNLTKETE